MIPYGPSTPHGRAAERKRPEAQHPPGIAKLPFGAFPPPATAAQKTPIPLGLIFQRRACPLLRGPRQGVQDGSRWLSEATPPVTGTKVPTTAARVASNWTTGIGERKHPEYPGRCGYRVSWNCYPCGRIEDVGQPERARASPLRKGGGKPRALQGYAALSAAKPGNNAEMRPRPFIRGATGAPVRRWTAGPAPATTRAGPPGRRVPSARPAFRDRPACEPR